MIFIFIILLRGMGLQCRLIVNMQPLPLRPVPSDLLAIKIKKNAESKNKSIAKIVTSSNKKTDQQTVSIKEIKNEIKKRSMQDVKNEEPSIKTGTWPDNSKVNTKSINKIKSKKVQNKLTQNVGKKICNNNGNGGKTKYKTVTKNLQQIENKTENGNEAAQKFQKQGNVCTTPEANDVVINFAFSQTNDESLNSAKCKQDLSEENLKDLIVKCNLEEQQNSRKVRLKPEKSKVNNSALEKRPNKEAIIETKLGAIPKKPKAQPASSSSLMKITRARSKSPQAHISTAFLLQSSSYKDKFSGIIRQNTNAKNKTARVKIPANKAKISTDFLQNTQLHITNKRVLRSRQKTNDLGAENRIPQLDGTNDGDDDDINSKNEMKSKSVPKKNLHVKKLKIVRSYISDDEFEPSPPKKPKNAPALSRKDRRVVSSEDENDQHDSIESAKKPTAGDMWIEVWCDVEEQWVCIDIFKGKIHCVDTIRKSASPSLAYVFAFQNDLSIKDVTARYCPNWTSVIRKSRIEKQWLDTAISKYLSCRTKRDIKEDEELRRIHEDKPMPTTISEYKNHPFYALERHLLKFEALYPHDAPALGYVRGEAVYSRDCVHTLHSREIWLKQARTVRVGEKPYKIVKARPKWDRITQTVIKDQALEIFGFWQTQDYEPPTAENGLVPRNAYGNVELFKPSMLPKKTKHIQLPGLNRICKKLGIDCANAVVGFDFHQGACHPTYDGFVVCEEFEDKVVAAWHQDQLEQERKEKEKYETRVYGNWKRLIRGLLIRERLKLKYNF